MANRISLRLIDGLHFIAETPSGHTVDMDSRVDESEMVAASPMEVQLAALAGCTAMDVISVLRKMRQDVVTYTLDLNGQRAAEHPKVYTSVDVVHHLSGANIGEENVRRAIELTIERYCPVFNMLYPAVAIRELYEITCTVTGATVKGEVVRPS